MSYTTKLITPEKLESVQYNVCLAITGAISGTSSEKLYQQLVLESLKSRRWFRKLCHFYKVLDEKSPSHLFDLIPNLSRVRETGNSNNTPAIHRRHNYFKNSFFLLLYLNGTILITKSETQKVSQFSKRTC